MSELPASAEEGQGDGGGPEPAPEGGDLQFDTIFSSRPPGSTVEIRHDRGDVTTKQPHED
jgi:hypothetical protein